MEVFNHLIPRQLLGVAWPITMLVRSGLETEARLYM